MDPRSLPPRRGTKRASGEGAPCCPAVRGGEIVRPKSHVVISISNYPIPQRPQPFGLAGENPARFPAKGKRAQRYFTRCFIPAGPLHCAIVTRLSTAECPKPVSSSFGEIFLLILFAQRLVGVRQSACERNCSSLLRASRR